MMTMTSVGSGMRVLMIVFLITFLLYISVLIATALKKRYYPTSSSFSHPRFRSSHTESQAFWNGDGDLNDLMDYGIIIDAGSSGSRVFIYVWPRHSGDPDDLLDIQPLRDSFGKSVAMKIEPGLSSNADNPKNSIDYIRPLLEFAELAIPRSKHRETPLYILSTAGMRLLPKMQQDDILSNLREAIPKNFTFLFSDTHAEVISGKQEGVYQWIATNYILDRLPHSHKNIPGIRQVGRRVDVKERQRTVGVIDMGGGSIQVAFEVNDTVGISKEVIAEINLGCTEHSHQHMYKLYVITYLGFGANIARKKYEKLLVEKYLSKHASSSSPLPLGFIKTRPIPDPCLPYKMPYDVKYEVTGKPTPTTHPVTSNFTTLYLMGSGNFSACYQSTVTLLNLSAPCPHHPCSFEGHHQPNISHDDTDFYAFSEFWYSLEDVLRLGSKPYKAETFVRSASQYCATNWRMLQSWYNSNLYPKADWNRFRMQCFKSAWVFAMLHKGLHFPISISNFHPTDLIEGQQVQWTLGALLYKARFLPLRDLQKKKSVASVRRSNGLLDLRALYKNEMFLTLCIIVVVLLVILYLRRLRVHKYVKRPTETSLRNLGYFITSKSTPHLGSLRDMESNTQEYSLVRSYDTWDISDEGLKMKL